MSYQHTEPFSRQITILVGLTVVGFMAFGLALSFYRNVLFEQTLANLSKQNNELRHTIDRGQQELEYYRSVQFKDKYAKEKLGRVKPGEKVLIITRDTPSYMPVDEENISLNQQQEAAYLELLRQMPVIEHWKLYLLHRERAEELKRSFYQT